MRFFMLQESKLRFQMGLTSINGPLDVLAVMASCTYFGGCIFHEVIIAGRKRQRVEIFCLKVVPVLEFTNNVPICAHKFVRASRAKFSCGSFANIREKLCPVSSW